MNFNNNHKKFIPIFEWLIILLSTVLLGIWATKGTIALRNLLLCVGALASIVYCYCSFKSRTKKIIFKGFIPILMVGLMFIWVVFHFIFLARFPEVQFQELGSTWLRAFLASLMGFGLGIVLFRKPNVGILLWIGILASFIYYLCQYYLLLLENQNILYYWKYEKFIYPGKIASVLAGTILISGVIGIFIDRLGYFNERMKWCALFYVSASIIAPLYIYIFIIDSRNGVGIAVLIMLFAATLLLGNLFIQKFFGLSQSKNKVKLLTLFGFIIIALSVAAIQTKTNSGWGSMIDDAKVALDINQYSNWKNPRLMGYPINASGKQVVANSYERISWALVGISILVPRDPLGIGVLSRPFGILLNAHFPDSGEYINSSHSAWVEIALAFGIPGLILLLGPLLLIAKHFVCLSISPRLESPIKFFPALLSFALICLYTVGEVSSKHAIEILLFWIAFLSSIYMLDSIRINIILSETKK